MHDAQRATSLLRPKERVMHDAQRATSLLRPKERVMHDAQRTRAQWAARVKEPLVSDLRNQQLDHAC
jgi:hypothetical protein